jgi:hypothetical protein
MPAHYYALRRLNPYRGVVEHVEVGNAEARSLDGVTWHLRADDGHGWVRPVGVWVLGEGIKAGVAHRHPELLAALEAMPPLPFPLADQAELWMLDRTTGQPLALLDSQPADAHRHGLAELEWIPFALRYRGFRSQALSEREKVTPLSLRHRDFLQRQVNLRARPYAAAQWFLRGPGGGGEGLTGYRLDAAWQGRNLAGEAFPELLISGEWNNRLEKSVIDDYHAWLAPFLLCWPDLSDPTRAELETAARLRPHWLVQVHRLLPKVLDEAGLKAALVAARLEQASGNIENDLID